MTQQIIVALIVALAAFYALWRWMPAGWRRAAAGKLATGSQRAGLVDAEQAQRLAQTLSKSSGCGACDSCGSCATLGAAQGASPETPLARPR
jgi:dihydroxyacid dehydratase/phosphogluconate dehydratase